MEKLNIFKIGGSVIDDKEKMHSFLESFSTLGGMNILVHGGGKIATRISDSLGIETKMIDGRRITTDEMIDVVTMTYGGLINKQIVSKLQGFGINAIGLTGADGNLMLSEKRPVKNSIDFGWVGVPKQVNGKWLNSLIKENQVPVIAPLTHDGNGNLLNTNADTIANVIGVELSKFFEVDINYCFELEGVLHDTKNPASLIKKLTSEKYLSLKGEGVIFHGMIPKLDNAFDAIEKGVMSVRIMSHQSISKLQNENYDEFTTIH
jgi:acetylglutamate kinase